MNYSRMTAELVSLILTLISTSVWGLKMVRLKVPAATDICRPVTLTCEYDLEGGNLYSVKWYKDEREFFRHTPGYEPHNQAFHTPGISLDLQNSDKNRVTLFNLTFTTSGNYKCEVSTEAPNFETVAQNSNMTVMAYPVEDPMIEGILSTYAIGDHVNANCTSGKSNPSAVIAWAINGVKVENLVSEYREGPDETDAHGLHTKTVGLQFQIENEHFTNNGGGTAPRMEISCISTVGEKTRHKEVFPALARQLTSNKLAQEGFRNSAGLLVTSPLNIVFVLITSLHAVCAS